MNSEMKDMQHQTFHFIGIGGIGMSAIALIMLDMGYKVYGSDVKEGKMVEQLRQAGATIFIGHEAANIQDDVEAVVYSSAVKADNVEMVEAKRRGLPIYQRAQMLAFLMTKKQSIGIAGAHGKTTTSGMMSLMLEQAGLDPTVVIGGTLPQIGGNAKSGRGDYLVAEADESDGTFLLLFPKIAVITNIEPDHLDHYESLQQIIDCFDQYLQQLPKDGLAIVNVDCPNTHGLLARIPCPVITYGFCEEADYRAFDLQHGPAGSSAMISFHGEPLGRLTLHVPGEHNVSNALAALAFGRHIGIDFDVLAEGLSHFVGTGRRFEYLGQFQGAHVVDDYAHHPTEIRATIKAARDMGAKRVVAVFQPHRYSRCQAMFEDFADSLQEADCKIVAKIYPAFEKPIVGVDAHLIVDAAVAAGQTNVHYAEDREQILRILKEEVRPDDLLLIMGAGDIRQVGEHLVKEE